MLPLNLLFVRHGQSDGNAIMKKAKDGDEASMTSEFVAQHSSRWRLTELGRQQNQQTRLWLDANFPNGFGLYLTSEYDRALESAAYLADANWRISPYLRERWWGDFDRMLPSERAHAFEQSLQDKRTSPYYWRPPNGEAMVDVSARLRFIYDMLHRERSQDNVLICCHGELIDSAAIECERLTERQYIQRLVARNENPELRLHNCQVIHYTRQNPEDDKDIRPYLSWKQSLCPSIDYYGPWEEIRRRDYSSAELLEMVASSPIFT